MTAQSYTSRPNGGTQPSRAVQLLGVLLACMLGAAACGGSSDDTSTEESSEAASGAVSSEETADTTALDADAGTSETADPAASPFPVTVTHKYGEITIEAPPQRVISVGYSDQDDLLALGVTPIAIRDWYGEQPHAVWPWATDELGDATPEVLPSSDLNIEQIAALQPDLIIGVSSGMTEDHYKLLSQIAPTLAQSGDYIDYGVPWQERTRAIGEVLGQSELAEELVAGIEERFTQVQVDHPEFIGATAAVAFSFNGDIGTYGSADSRSTIMRALGFTIPAVYDEIAGTSFYASFSEENIDLLDVDALAWIAGDETAVQAIIDSPLRSALMANAEGRELMVGGELGGAFSFASPLSLGFLLDELVPELVLALDGDPATPVPSMGG